MIFAAVKVMPARNGCKSQQLWRRLRRHHKQQQWPAGDAESANNSSRTQTNAYGRADNSGRPTRDAGTTNNSNWPAGDAESTNHSGWTDASPNLLLLD
jgi:hypothetical protein